MHPIFEIPTRGDVDTVRVGEDVYKVHQLRDGANVVEAPAAVGAGNEWRRRFDLEKQFRGEREKAEQLRLEAQEAALRQAAEEQARDEAAKAALLEAEQKAAAEKAAADAKAAAVAVDPPASDPPADDPSTAQKSRKK